MSIDYKALLEKYMTLVIDCESYSYLDEEANDEFTEAEMRVLREMETKCYGD